MKKNGVLFDLDGTLWEVTNRTFESINEVARKYKLKEINKETVCRVFGLNRIESAQMYFPYLELNKALKITDEISILNIKNLKKYGGNIYPNLEDTLIKLKNNYELFIVSNTGQSEYIEAFLISSGLFKYFNSYIAASELNISKADAIKKVIKENELEKAVYIGDTKKDFEASKLANIPFIQAKYGFGDDLRTEYYINSIDELPNIIQILFN